MTSLAVDIEGGDEGAPTVTPPASDLLAFCSFAYAARFGSQHELAILAKRLKDRYKVDLRPFTTYVDGAVHDQEDAEDLERAWQEPAKLAESAADVLEVIRSGDSKVPPLLEDWPGLAPRLEELAARALWAAANERRIRLTFMLE